MMIVCVLSLDVYMNVLVSSMKSEFVEICEICQIQIKMNLLNFFILKILTEAGLFMCMPLLMS
jgi:hypothetical protein